VFFFPYRADLELLQVPLLTFLICLAAALLYWAQAANEQELSESTKAFCAKNAPRDYQIIIKTTTGRSAKNICPRLMFQLRRAADAEQFVRTKIIREARFARYTPEQSQNYMTEIVLTQFNRYLQETPEYLTAKLWYQPETFNPLTMLSAALAHGSWSHLIGNLFFFFAFAATVEVILGMWRFVVLVLALAIGTHVAYSLTSLGMDTPVPTVGLSGVVMGTMGMFAWFLPAHGIRCIWWFFVIFKRVVIPAWVLFVWYLGWDLYALTQDERSGVNLVAHISGALIGYGIGFTLFRGRKQEVLLMRGA
jgi:membrane associated rhomboid family serine protease